MKKILSLLVLIFTLMGGQAVMGVTQTPIETPPVESLPIETPIETSIDTRSKIGDVIHPDAYEAIWWGESMISDAGNGIIHITGETYTYYPVDEVGLTLHLQQYYGGKWYTLASYSYYKYDSDYIFGGRVIKVDKGNFYRVFAEHSALDGSIYETGVTTTGSLYIN